LQCRLRLRLRLRLRDVGEVAHHPWMRGGRSMLENKVKVSSELGGMEPHLSLNPNTPASGCNI